MTSKTGMSSLDLGRREVLQAGAALSVAALAACRDDEAASPASTIDLPGAEELVPERMPKGFSKGELERRWAKTREWMKKAKFDCLLVPARTQGNADVKYLRERRQLGDLPLGRTGDVGLSESPGIG